MSAAIWSNTQTFSAPSGEATVVAIRAPYRGVLRGYSLVQTSGASAGLTAKLLSSNQTKAPNSTYPEDAFLVAAITLPSGQTTAFDEDADIAYQNRDGDPSNGQRFLYLKITPAGTGAKAFAFTVTVETTRPT
jgi:hypothetical protein